MKTLVLAIENCLEQNGIAFRRTDLPGVLSTGYKIVDTLFPSSVEIDEDEPMIRVRTWILTKVAEDQRPAVAELFTRINPGLHVSTLELDLDSGQMTCRTSVALGRSEPHPEVVKQLLGVNWRTVEIFFPVITAVLCGDVSPKEAVDEVNRGLSTSDDPGNHDPNEVSRIRLDDIQRGSLN